jgi:tetratricopeptide (TPR) repeat protein
MIPGEYYGIYQTAKKGARVAYTYDDETQESVTIEHQEDGTWRDLTNRVTVHVVAASSSQSAKHAEYLDAISPMPKGKEEAADASELIAANAGQAEVTSASDIQPKPQDANAYFKRGATWHRKGDYDRAISDFTEAIKLEPNFPSAFDSRGMAWDDKAEYDRAISDYNEAIEIQPEYADAFFNRGLARSHKNDKDRAIADFRRAYYLFGPNGTYREAVIAQLQSLGVTQP